MKSKETTKKTKKFDPLEKDIVDKFSNSLRQLIEDKKKEANKKGTSIFEKNMYEEMDIGKTTLQNYKKEYDEGGKIPSSAELVKIHDYFNVSYSFLFGESTLKLNNNDKLIELGVKLGLDDASINTLANLKKKSISETTEDNFEAYIKLFLINSLIQDKKLLDSLTTYFSITLGRNIIDEKFKENKQYSNISTSDSIYDMTKYAIMTNWIKTIEGLVQAKNVPIKIRKNTEQYAIKYAGEMQTTIKDILNDKKK